MRRGMGHGETKTDEKREGDAKRESDEEKDER